MITADSLKQSAKLFEAKLNKAAKNNKEAEELLLQVKLLIDEAKQVTSITDFKFRRLRFGHVFLEGQLGNDISLFNAYATFANQFEGLGV